MANQNHCMSIKQAKLVANAHNVLFYVCSHQGDIRHTKRGKTLRKRKKGGKICILISCTNLPTGLVSK